jgi:hypothetical protein
MSRNALTRLVIAAVGGIAIVVGAHAQTGGAPKAEAEADVAVQPDAVAALDKMGAYLRTLKEFRIIADTIDDEELEDGQTVEIAGRAIYEVRRPDRLKLEVITDAKERELYYDGKTVSHYAPALDLYSVFPAPETIGKMLEETEVRYDVSFPLADLFYWGTELSNVKELTSAYFVGESRIAGNVCEHYAYRAPGADFQVWIRKGGDPLPCRLVVIDTDTPARARYSATLQWEPQATLGDSIFSFSPPGGATKIEQAPTQ